MDDCSDPAKPQCSSYETSTICDIHSTTPFCSVTFQPRPGFSGPYNLISVTGTTDNTAVMSGSSIVGTTLNAYKLGITTS